jgi:hypothetical protein
MVERAELTDLNGRFSGLGSSVQDLHLAIREVKAALTEIETEVLKRH